LKKKLLKVYKERLTMLYDFSVINLLHFHKLQINVLKKKLLKVYKERLTMLYDFSVINLLHM